MIKFIQTMITSSGKFIKVGKSMSMFLSLSMSTRALRRWSIVAATMTQNCDDSDDAVRMKSILRSCQVDALTVPTCK